MASTTADSVTSIASSDRPATQIFKRALERLVATPQQAARERVSLYLKRLDKRTLHRIGFNESEIADLMAHTSARGT